MNGDAFIAGWGLGDCGCGCAGAGDCAPSPGLGFLPFVPTTGPVEQPWWDPWGSFDWPSIDIPTVDWWIPGPIAPIFQPDSCGRLAGDPAYGSDCAALPSPCGTDARGFQIAPVIIKDSSGAITGIRCPDLGTGGAPICQNVCPGGYVRESITSCNCIPNPAQPQNQSNRNIAGGGSGSSGGTSRGGAQSGSGAGATPQQQCASVGKIYDQAQNRCVPPPVGTAIQQLCQQTGLAYDAQLNVCYRPEITGQGLATVLPWALGALALFTVLR